MTERDDENPVCGQLWHRNERQCFETLLIVSLDYGPMGARGHALYTACDADQRRSSFMTTGVHVAMWRRNGWVLVGESAQT